MEKRPNVVGPLAERELRPTWSSSLCLWIALVWLGLCSGCDPCSDGPQRCSGNTIQRCFHSSHGGGSSYGDERECGPGTVCRAFGKSAQCVSPTLKCPDGAPDGFRWCEDGPRTCFGPFARGVKACREGTTCLEHGDVAACVYDIQPCDDGSTRCLDDKTYLRCGVEGLWTKQEECSSQETCHLTHDGEDAGCEPI